MADASDIYRRFVAAPLRLKPRKPSPSPPSTPPSSAQQHDPRNTSPWGESPAFSTRFKEVQKLRRRVGKINISTQQGTIPNTADIKSAANKDSMASKLLSKKEKRVTRSVNLPNEDTGGEFVDTPTKASQPPKRIRKFSWGFVSEKDKKESHNVFNFYRDGAESDGDEKEENVTAPEPRKRIPVTITLPIRRSRRLQHIKAESPKLAPVQQVKASLPKVSLPQKSLFPEQKAVPVQAVKVGTCNPNLVSVSIQDPVMDFVSPMCDALLKTETISGCFFALSLNALRDAKTEFIANFTSPSRDKTLESIFNICLGIAECEKIAQRSFTSKSPPTKSPESSKFELPGRRRRSSFKKVNRVKKSVRFRSFDLSCLNLQYVEDEQVAVMVDKILIRYGAIMEHVEKMISRFDTGIDDLDRAVLRDLVNIMTNSSALYDANVDRAERNTSKRIYRRAYGGRDLYSQHEIRISGEYFARQFANLLVSPRGSPTPQFLQSVFSSLVLSTIRFKLRVLFIESEDFGEEMNGSDVLQNRVMLDEDGKPFPAMAPYEHQDLGAAIHWALQESVLYRSLVQPLQDIFKCEEGSLGEESLAKSYLDESAAEDLDHMEKYVLARRFLRFHLTKSWRQRLEADEEVAKIWDSVEKICSVAKRFHFEDETHLYPMASLRVFIETLAREEPTLKRMEEMLQSFYEQKYGVSGVQSEPCMECHAIITREENLASIRCTSCARRFHLGCLHLPESFAQFAERYTCPACFLGRGAY